MLTLMGVTYLPTPAFSQFKVGGKDVQIHGFVQQGFAVSTNNNFLSMKTRDGSFSMTDGGLNVSMKLTPKLRVGAQAFSRNIGEIGNGQVQLDWAYADYRFNDFVGVRGGKVKTTLGLFNDTQDMEFVHAFALLPQSVYPTDQRATTIAHVGGDIYGEVSLRKAGRLNYVVYAGERPDDNRGGYYLGTRDNGTPINKYKATVSGGDLRWVTPLEGLTMGYSYFRFHGYANGHIAVRAGVPLPAPGIPFRNNSRNATTNAGYTDFQRGKLRLFGEIWMIDQLNQLTELPSYSAPTTYQRRAWYVAGTYRVHPKVELGSYYSDYRSNRNNPFSNSNGIRGPVVSARFDVNKYWNVKLESHFIEGHADSLSSRTFYLSTNPQGYKPRTNLFLIRTGLVF